MAFNNVWNNYYQNKKKTPKVYSNQNPIEAAKSIGSDVVQKVNTELVGGTVSSAFEQIGIIPKQGSLGINGEIDLTQFQSSTIGETKINTTIHPGIVHAENIITQEQIFVQKENQQAKCEINQILKELKILAESMKNFEHEVSKVAIETSPQNMGVYHKNFFEWLITMIRDLRKQVSESTTWLSVFKSKKKKRGYWNMFKKHGTQFGLSDERVIATSTG